MSRSTLLSATLVLTGLIVVGGRLSADDPVGADKHLPRVKTAMELQRRLEQKVDTLGFEPNTPLRDALGFCSEHFGITFLIDTQAFKDDFQINEIGAQPVKLPLLRQVPLRWILQQVVEQQLGTI